MKQTAFVLFTGVILFLFVAAAPNTEQKHGNAEVKHQQLIAEQLNKPSAQEMLANFLVANENIQLMVMETLRNAMHNDPGFTMNCKMMADGKEATCCRLSDSEHDDHHKKHQ